MAQNIQLSRLIAKRTHDLAAIPFFPAEASAAIMDAIAKFVDKPERLNWLVDTAVQTMRKWDGVAELRGLYCTRFKPADGIEAPCLTTPGYTPEDCETAHAFSSRAYTALSEQDARALSDLRQRDAAKRRTGSSGASERVQ